jgi:hypothetical protein
MKKAWFVVYSLLFILGPMAQGGRLTATQTGPAMPDDVKAIFKERCSVCHKGKYPPQQLNLAARESRELRCRLPEGPR